MEHDTALTEAGMDIISKQAQVSMFLNEQRFEFAQRIGKMLAASTMIPDHYRNNLGNCMIALNLAERLGVDVFGLMQTSYVVHGRPGFEAKLLIAVFNSHTKLFIPPLRWETRGEFPKCEDAACRAYAIDKETNEPLYGEWIDYDMVKGEGWYDKNGSKWKTMPGQMFRYRAASFFINAYEPGLKMGIQTTDELEDTIIDITPTMKIKGNIEAPTEDIYKVNNDQESTQESPNQEQESKTEEETEDINNGKKVDSDQEYIDRFKDLKKVGLLEFEKSERNMLPLMTKTIQEAFADKFKRVIGQDYNEWLNNPNGNSQPDKGNEQFWEDVDFFTKELGLPVVNRILGISPFHCKEVKDVPDGQRKDFLKALGKELDQKNLG